MFDILKRLGVAPLVDFLKHSTNIFRNDLFNAIPGNNEPESGIVLHIGDVLCLGEHGLAPKEHPWLHPVILVKGWLQTVEICLNESQPNERVAELLPVGRPQSDLCRCSGSARDVGLSQEIEFGHIPSRETFDGMQCPC